MVRSHALYPIELRAHCGEITSLNYNGNRIVLPNPIAGRARRKTLSRGRLRFRMCAKFRSGCGNRGLAEIEGFHIRVKVSGPAQNLPAPAFYPRMLARR